MARSAGYVRSESCYHRPLRSPSCGTRLSEVLSEWYRARKGYVYCGCIQRLQCSSATVDFQVVLYRRHTRQSMRFYTFDFNELDILPLQDSAQDKLPAATRNANASLEADFTRTRGPASQRRSGLDEEVLLQVSVVWYNLYLLKLMGPYVG